MQITKETYYKINVIIIRPPKACFSHKIPTRIKGVISNTDVLVAEFTVFCHAIGNKGRLAWRSMVLDTPSSRLLLFKMTTTTMMLEVEVSEGGDVGCNKFVS